MALASNLGSSDIKLPAQRSAPAGGGEDSEGTRPARRSFRGGRAPVNRRSFARIPLRGAPCYGAAMGQDRVSDALSRIERAVARIEAASGRLARSGDGGGDGGDFDGLRQAHLALRDKVASAIAQIDRLLEAEGRN